MAEETHYQVLEIAETATQGEVKQAYRRLAKRFHPDSQSQSSSHERITRINAAYEVLADPQRRTDYDQARGNPTRSGAERNQRAADMQSQYRQQRRSSQDSDTQVETWIRRVYTPVDRLIGRVISSLAQELRALSADPFDDELIEGFNTYLETCRSELDKAEGKFQSMANPAVTAKVAASLYHCLKQLEDGVEEMERFTYCYEESYLHTGQELFRIAKRLRQEAKAYIQRMP